ncbi:MAG: DUF2314 domain-containing protein [Paracoccaceae bacterium]
MRWRTKVRLSATLALIGATTLANIGVGASAEDASPVVTLQAGHLAMSDAEAAAQRHFKMFLAHVLKPDGATLEGAAVKIAVPTGNGHAEVIWVTPFAQTTPTQFLGAYANTPQSIPNAVEGDAVAFEAGQVRDWSFMGSDTKLYGSFTTRVLLPHIPREQAAQIAAVLSDVPVPAEWSR